MRHYIFFARLRLKPKRQDLNSQDEEFDIMTVDTSQEFHSQHGEDRWLSTYFKGRQSGYFVEVGAYDGVIFSNTLHFEQLGWTGILVEPDPDNAASCRKFRPQSVTYQCAMVEPEAVGEITFYKITDGEVYSTTSLSDSHRARLTSQGMSWREITVAARTLDSVLEEANPPKVDFISIDVEGGELAVLRGFTIQRWKPHMVIVETNAKVRDRAIRDFFVANGYAYRHSIDINDFYEPLSVGSGLVALIDGVRYRGHRASRRLTRLRERMIRAWKKYGLGKSST